MNRKFGLELEIAGISQQTALAALKAVNINVQAEGYNHTTRSHWKIVSDSSVRDGFEIVSPILEGEAGICEAEIVARALDDAGASVNSSCGLHVHFDASGLDAAAIKTIVTRYAAHEAEIDAFMPPSRRGNSNRYCGSLALMLNNGFNSASSIHEMIRAQSSRYFKINLQSLDRHGTIEFRQHAGTVNAAKIANWVRFLAAFIDECLRMAHGAGRELPELSGVQGRLAAMFASQGVVKLAGICETFGWLEKTARAAVTRLRKAGMEISATRLDGAAAYRFNGAGAENLWAGVSREVALFYQRRAAVLAAAA